MDKTLLITGCSSGIGLCAALSLQARGYQVFATARKASDVDRLQQLGLLALQMDMDDTLSIDLGLKSILEKTGGTLSAIFNNAGYVQAGAAEDLSRDAIRAQFESNVFGPMELIARVLPIMRQQGYGRIIQNSSILGVVSMPFRGAYNASKYALEGFSNTLRQELRGTPIKVSILAPGPIRTEIQHNAYKKFLKTIRTDSIHQKTYQQIGKEVVMPDKDYPFYIAKPEAVVKCLIHALESTHPKAHYFIGMPAKILAFLRRILPDNVLDRLACSTSHKTKDI